MMATLREHQGDGRLLQWVLPLWHHVVPISCKHYAWSLDLLSHLWSENYGLLVVIIPLDVVEFFILLRLWLSLVIEEDPHRWCSFVAIVFIILLVLEKLVLWLALRVPWTGPFVTVRPFLVSCQPIARSLKVSHAPGADVRVSTRNKCLIPLQMIVLCILRPNLIV